MVKYDKVVLINPYGNLHKVGCTYEIANITETSYVLRDEKTKIAIAVISIEDFEKYFKLKENKKYWTSWEEINDKGKIVAVYRTNGKKVQVKLLNNKYRSEATCSKFDKFDITTGICIAYLRCLNKEYRDTYETAMAGIKETDNMIKSIIDNIK